MRPPPSPSSGVEMKYWDCRCGFSLSFQLPATFPHSWHLSANQSDRQLTRSEQRRGLQSQFVLVSLVVKGVEWHLDVRGLTVLLKRCSLFSGKIMLSDCSFVGVAARPDLFFSFILFCCISNNNKYKIKKNRYRILKSMYLLNWIIFFSFLDKCILLYSFQLQPCPLGIYRYVFTTIWYRMVSMVLIDSRAIFGPYGAIRYDSVTFFALKFNHCDSEINTWVIWK